MPFTPALLLMLAAAPDSDLAESARAILETRCSGCHGAEKQKGGLRVDSREALLRGGRDAGPAVVPGQPDRSPLHVAVARTNPDVEMPPDEALPPGEVALLRRWVEAGAPWPRTASQAPKRRPEKAITAQDRAWWAFQPLREPPLPAREGHPIDRFVRATLASRGLRPAAEADRRTLIRRVTFDLHGMPPTPEEVEAFVADRAPGAYERVVDRLLASPRYGERLARLWLDVVRFAESDGYRQDAFRPEAWSYRDWVVRAFNQDMPYDRFVLEQLAGDEVAPHDPNVVVATGFLRLGQYEFNQRDVRGQWSAILDDVTDVTGDAFLGLGLACARCHDHKFDPLLQRDYYRLRAFFAPMVWRDGAHLATPQQEEEYARALAAWQERTAVLRAEISALERPYLEQADKIALDHFPLEIQALLRRSPAELGPEDRQIFGLAFRQVAYERGRVDGLIKGPERQRWSELKRRLAELGKAPKPPLRAFVVNDVTVGAGPATPVTTLPGQRQPLDPGFPLVIDPEAPVIAPPDTAPGSTGRRTALARWIGGSPLASRVWVNRLWQRFFSRGLVATASDFGRLGEPPSHPALLEWLSSRFVAEGRGAKAIDRLIVTSATYRQASQNRGAGRRTRRIDPDNRLLWRQRVRRLEAEEVRDAILATTGEIDDETGGPSVEASVPRRALYVKTMRNSREPLLAAFDGADGLVSTPARNVTTTAAQALLMLNGRWVLGRAEAFAASLLRWQDDRARIDQAHSRAFGRAPRPDERRRMLSFLRQSQAAASAEPTGPTTETMPHRGGKALRVRAGRVADRWVAPVETAVDAVALEAIAQLDGVGDEGQMRVVASLEGGLTLGISGRGAADGGRHLVARVGEHEVRADLRIELHRPYYLAVNASGGGGAGVTFTFHVRDLSDPDAPLKTVQVGPRAIHVPAGRRLIIGGQASGLGWEGLVDEVRVSPSLRPQEALFEDGAAAIAGATHVTFERPGERLTPLATAPAAERVPPGWVDVCHVLLNANEFLFVE